MLQVCKSIFCFLVEEKREKIKYRPQGDTGQQSIYTVAFKWMDIVHDCFFSLPSSDAPLDLKIKSSMLSDMFSLVGEYVCQRV